MLLLSYFIPLEMRATEGGSNLTGVTQVKLAMVPSCLLGVFTKEHKYKYKRILLLEKEREQVSYHYPLSFWLIASLISINAFFQVVEHLFYWFSFL